MLGSSITGSRAISTFSGSGSASSRKLFRSATSSSRAGVLSLRASWRPALRAVLRTTFRVPFVMRLLRRGNHAGDALAPAEQLDHHHRRDDDDGDQDAVLGPAGV